MTLRLHLALAAGLLAVSAPALAQTPAGGDTGGGVVRVAKPVTGQQVYEAVCQACHMADAKGAVGAGVFPSLANNPRLGTTAYASYIIANGKGGMPWFRDTLSKDQARELISYLRTHFGNDFKDPVTADDVAAFGQPPSRR